uniref:Mitogen-activated protein kinase kinase kinase 7-like n=1 Tax=Drosophila rhopaloa TaxID=1041015 RepID=A0A6P4F400_DRORH
MAEKVDFAELQLSERIGVGAGGAVRKATWKDQEIAVKVSELLTESLKKNAEREITHLTNIDHENVIRVFGSAIDDVNNTNYILMEYMEGGSLYDFLYDDNQREFTMEQAVRWAYQCAKGLAHMHAMERAVLHRDVKPQNLLLTEQFDQLKICDFGLATDMSNNMSDMRGTARYMAPEVFKNKEYTDKGDVYSTGIVIWEIMSRQRPYFHLENPDNEYAIFSAVAKGERPRMDALRSDCWEGIKKLIECCLDEDPSRRPSMKRVEEYLGELCAGENCEDFIQMDASRSDCWEGIKQLVECCLDEDPSRRPSMKLVEEYLGELCAGENYEDFIQVLGDDSVAVVTFVKDPSSNRNLMRVDFRRRQTRTARMIFPIVQREMDRLGKVVARETVRAAHDGEREVRRAENDTEREVSRAAHDGERETRRAAQDVGRETKRAFNKTKKKLGF